MILSHKILGITPAQRRNFCILMVGVRDIHITKTIKLRVTPAWEMGNFFNDYHEKQACPAGFRDLVEEAHQSARHCTRCLIGHAPLVGLPPVNGETWISYTIRVFGMKAYCRAWQWMFDCNHTCGEHGPGAALLRVSWYLEHWNKALDDGNSSNAWFDVFNAGPGNAEAWNLRTGSYDYTDIPWGRIEAIAKGGKAKKKAKK